MVSIALVQLCGMEKHLFVGNKHIIPLPGPAEACNACVGIAGE